MSATASLRLDRRAGGAVLERRLESMPGKRRALDPRRIGLDAEERLQPLHVVGERRRERGLGTARHLGVEALEERVRFFSRLALEDFRHERSRGLRDGAAAALEAHILDAAILERHEYGDAVAAERVVAMRQMARMLLLAEIPRALPMVEDDVLIEIAQIHGYVVTLNIFCAAWIAAASASMSLSSL